MSTKPQLLISNCFHPETIEILDEKYTTHHLWECSDKETRNLILELQGECSAAATASWVCNDAIYELNSLRVIACFGVGVDAIDFDKTQQKNIQVTNTPDVLNQAVADVALSLVLATTRNLINADKFVREKKWQQGPFPFGMGLSGKTLGIIGCGRIGEEIALRALTFGLKIAYHNRHPKNLPFDYYSSIRELAHESDILLCMLPGGDETRNIINEEIFRALGPDGIFLNVGRGSSVDEEALVAALKQKHILAAGLDVYADEPNVPEPLLAMDNVVLLPHIGSATVETRRAMGQLVIDNLAAYFAGQPLLTEVR
ncbi:MAG: 2-hydroxyacid dehydrogenase [Pseudohongiellaceae bacterium]